MDVTERRISKIARAVSHFTTRRMRRSGIGTAELDLVHLVRRHPGITQAEVCQKLDMDKGAVARCSANLETKGYLCREPNPEDKRSLLLFCTEKADELKNSRTRLEELFYEWLTEPFSDSERAQLARMLEVMDQRCHEERRAHFAHMEQLADEAMEKGEEG